MGEVDMVMRSSHQLPVPERVGVDDACQRVAEDMRVVAVVEPPLQFFEVAVHMLGAHLVERADDGALEQAPDTFNAVGVDVADDPFLGTMVDGLMAGVSVADANVALEFIGVDRLGLVAHGALDEGMERGLTDVWDALDTDAAAALDGPCYPVLVVPVGAALTLDPATYERLIYFHDSDQCGAGEGVVTHRFADAVAQVPGRPVGYSEGAVKLVSGYPFLALAPVACAR